MRTDSLLLDANILRAPVSNISIVVGILPLIGLLIGPRCGPPT